MQTIVSYLYRKPNSKIGDFIESMFNYIEGSVSHRDDLSIDLLQYNVNNDTKLFF